MCLVFRDSFTQPISRRPLPVPVSFLPVSLALPPCLPLPLLYLVFLLYLSFARVFLDPLLSVWAYRLPFHRSEFLFSLLVFQYPASGLLLRDEFRTFVEIENEGERVYEPVEPLVRLLRNFGIADSGSSTGIGKKQLYETLVMRVTVPPHSRSWGLNICPRDHKQFEEIIFHFNPRRRFVAMNHRDGNVWGQQVRYFSFVSCLVPSYTYRRVPRLVL